MAGMDQGGAALGSRLRVVGAGAEPLSWVHVARRLGRGGGGVTCERGIAGSY